MILNFLKKKSNQFFLILVLILSKPIYSQINLKGFVKDSLQNPIPYCVASIKKNDSNIINNVLGDSLGVFKFDNLKEGSYLLKVQSLGYLNYEKRIALVKDSIIQVLLNNSYEQLSEVVVNADKPIIEQKTDRLRFNVENSDMVFGNSALDILGKTSLVNVSTNGDLSINGNTGVVVYVNNRKKIFSGDALKNYLNSVSSDNIKAIEVITTPPSEYDSEGGAGIINIITKRNKTEGLQGGVTLSARQRSVFSKAISNYLNFRQGKWNINSTMYLSDIRRVPHFIKDINYANSILEKRYIDLTKDNQTVFSGINIGTDYEINSKHIIGAILDYSGHDEKENRNGIMREFRSTSVDEIVSNNNDNEDVSNYSLNLNYLGKFNDLGKSLSFDFDVFRYKSAINSLNISDLINASSTINRDWFRSISDQKINNISYKVDFTNPFNSKLTLKIGGKSSFSTIKNDLLFEDRVSDNEWIKDLTRSNLFDYDENIHSLYASLNYKLNDFWAFQVGSRVEFTSIKGWLENEKVVDNDYVNVFPTVFLSYKPNKNHNFSLSSTSRITRPSFWDVNPFRQYTTDITYFEGNPFLSPTKYYRQEFGYTLKKNKVTLITKLGTSQTIDEFFSLPSELNDGSIVNQKVNYGNKYSYFNSYTGLFKVKDWWKINATFLLGYVQTQGSYGNNIRIDNGTSLYRIAANQTINISKKKKISLTLITNNTFPVKIVNTKIKNRLETEIVLRKSIRDFNITLSARDLFRSNKDRYDIQIKEQGISILDTNYYDTQSIAFAISYSFGNSSVKGKRNRRTGNSDEKSRL